MTEEIFETNGAWGVEQIKKNLYANGMVVTAGTVNSLKYEADSKSVSIYGREFFQAVETGSKPSTKNPSPEMVESLKEWADTRGIQAKPYAIAKSILKKGSKLWREGGRTDIFTNVEDEMVKRIGDELVKSLKI